MLSTERDRGTVDYYLRNDFEDFEEVGKCIGLRGAGIPEFEKSRSGIGVFGFRFFSSRGLVSVEGSCWNDFVGLGRRMRLWRKVL